MISAGNVNFFFTVANSERERLRGMQRSDEFTSTFTSAKVILRVHRNYREIHDSLKYRIIVGTFSPSVQAITCI